MITFLAFQGDATLRSAVLDRLALTGQGSVPEQLAGSGADMAAAHQATGFPRSLLLLVEAIHAGLADSERMPFLVELVQAATVTTDLADVPDLFFGRLLAEVLALHGAKTLRASTGAMVPLAGFVVDADWPTRATMKVVDRAGEGVPMAVRWLAGLAADPAAEYQRMARELIELVRLA